MLPVGGLDRHVAVDDPLADVIRLVRRIQQILHRPRALLRPLHIGERFELPRWPDVDDDRLGIARQVRIRRRRWAGIWIGVGIWIRIRIGIRVRCWIGIWIGVGIWIRIRIWVR